MRNITQEVKNCLECPFLMGGVECSHPYWDDKGVYDNLIIESNSIPEECPLRIGSITKTIRLYNDKV